MKLISVRLPEAYIEGLEELVRRNMYSGKSEAARMTVKDLIEREKDLPPLGLRSHSLHYSSVALHRKPHVPRLPYPEEEIY